MVDDIVSADERIGRSHGKDVEERAGCHSGSKEQPHASTRQVHSEGFRRLFRMRVLLGDSDGKQDGPNDCEGRHYAYPR